MVRAILSGQKTQTRRVVTRSTSDADAWQRLDLARAWVDPGLSGLDAYLKAPLLDAPGDPADERIERVRCRYVPLDRLWVRETWAVSDASEGEIKYLADGSTRRFLTDGEPDWWKRWGKRSERGRWQPSIYMPRWASRLTLAVESIRVERLQDISEEDARAEGCEASVSTIVVDDRLKADEMMVLEGGVLVERARSFTFSRSARDRFRDLWQSINGKRPGCSWDANPWVWVVKFSRVTP